MKKTPPLSRERVKEKNLPSLAISPSLKQKEQLSRKGIFEEDDEDDSGGGENNGRLSRKRKMKRRRARGAIAVTGIQREQLLYTG